MRYRIIVFFIVLLVWIGINYFMFLYTMALGCSAKTALLASFTLNFGFVPLITWGAWPLGFLHWAIEGEFLP